MISLNRAKEFHGHLGPYLILGVLIGECGLKKLKARKYFSLKVKVRGVGRKPRSCLIDGLQLSTGAPYGKGNIEKLNGKNISVVFYNLLDKRKIKISLKNNLVKRLNLLKGHKESENFARKIYKSSPDKLFNVETDNNF
jgi:formylmethanofuran dehydrogenase subunit E